MLHPPADGGVRSPFAFTGDQCIRAANLLGGARAKIAELDNAINSIDATHPGAPPRSFVLVDKQKPVEPVVFLRGDPQRKGPKVPRHFLTVLGGGEPFTAGSGRKELAEAVASPTNPLTARVFVNRVWAHHFGKGLVDTPSDFGFRSNPPSHPELLDWLAATFVEEGWSVKALHRRIVLSNTYRLRSEDLRGDAALRVARARTRDAVAVERAVRCARAGCCRRSRDGRARHRCCCGNDQEVKKLHVFAGDVSDDSLEGPLHSHPLRLAPSRCARSSFF
jgi:hypothetical protein